jgi:hypothetical protein
VDESPAQITRNPRSKPRFPPLMASSHYNITPIAGQHIDFCHLFGYNNANNRMSCKGFEPEE